MIVKGPFFNQKKAAEYCGYSISTFVRKIRKYEIPLVGPDRNRFAQSLLDLWMEEPDFFNRQEKVRKRKFKKVLV